MDFLSWEQLPDRNGAPVRGGDQLPSVNSPSGPMGNLLIKNAG